MDATEAYFQKCLQALKAGTISKTLHPPPGVDHIRLRTLMDAYDASTRLANTVPRPPTVPASASATVSSTNAIPSASIPSPSAPAALRLNSSAVPPIQSAEASTTHRTSQHGTSEYSAPWAPGNHEGAAISQQHAGRDSTAAIPQSTNIAQTVDARRQIESRPASAQSVSTAQSASTPVLPISAPSLASSSTPLAMLLAQLAPHPTSHPPAAAPSYSYTYSHNPSQPPPNLYPGSSQRQYQELVRQQQQQQLQQQLQQRQWAAQQIPVQQQALQPQSSHVQQPPAPSLSRQGVEPSHLSASSYPGRTSDTAADTSRGQQHANTTVHTHGGYANSVPRASQQQEPRMLPRAAPPHWPQNQHPRAQTGSSSASIGPAPAAQPGVTTSTAVSSNGNWYNLAPHPVLPESAQPPHTVKSSGPSHASSNQPTAAAPYIERPFPGLNDPRFRVLNTLPFTELREAIRKIAQNAAADRGGLSSSDAELLTKYFAIRKAAYEREAKSRSIAVSNTPVYPNTPQSYQHIQTPVASSYPPSQSFRPENRDPRAANLSSQSSSAQIALQAQVLQTSRGPSHLPSSVEAQSRGAVVPQAANPAVTMSRQPHHTAVAPPPAQIGNHASMLSIIRAKHSAPSTSTSASASASASQFQLPQQFGPHQQQRQQPHAESTYIATRGGSNAQVRPQPPPLRMNEISQLNAPIPHPPRSIYEGSKNMVPPQALPNPPPRTTVTKFGPTVAMDILVALGRDDLIAALANRTYRIPAHLMPPGSEMPGHLPASAYAPAPAPAPAPALVAATRTSVTSISHTDPSTGERGPRLQATEKVDPPVSEASNAAGGTDSRIVDIIFEAGAPIGGSTSFTELTHSVGMHLPPTVKASSSGTPLVGTLSSLKRKRSASPPGSRVATALIAKSAVDPTTTGVSNIVAPATLSTLVKHASLGRINSSKTASPVSVHRGSSEEVEDNLQQLVVPVNLGDVSPTVLNSRGAHAHPKGPSPGRGSHVPRGPLLSDASSTAPRQRSPSLPTDDAPNATEDVLMLPSHITTASSEVQEERPLFLPSPSPSLGPSPPGTAEPKKVPKRKPRPRALSISSSSSVELLGRPAPSASKPSKTSKPAKSASTNALRLKPIHLKPIELQSRGSTSSPPRSPSPRPRKHPTYAKAWPPMIDQRTKEFKQWYHRPKPQVIVEITSVPPPMPKRRKLVRKPVSQKVTRTRNSKAEKDSSIPCKWTYCTSRLESRDKLRKHLRVRHGNSATSCLWDGCYRIYGDAAKTVRHIMRDHAPADDDSLDDDNANGMPVPDITNLPNMPTQVPTFQLAAVVLPARISAQRLETMRYQQHLLDLAAESPPNSPMSKRSPSRPPNRHQSVQRAKSVAPLITLKHPRRVLSPPEESDVDDVVVQPTGRDAARDASFWRDMTDEIPSKFKY